MDDSELIGVIEGRVGRKLLTKQVDFQVDVLIKLGLAELEL